MKLMLDKYTIHAIAEEVANVLEERRKPRLVTTEEAAKTLGISPTHLRRIKDRFGYVKIGDGQRGKLRFNADTLVDSFLSS